jgi:hypothetical protein
LTTGCSTPKRGCVGENAFFVAYPGLHREAKADELAVCSMPFCDGISSVSDRQFVLADLNLEREEIPYADNLKMYGSTGGISGGLVFAERNKQVVPIGVIYEGGKTKNATFFVTHLDFILEDGKIDQLRVP